MSANRESQTWWDSVIDRQRSLAITTPIQELDGNKTHVGAAKHDVRTYCPYAIDQVVLGMRAHRGERLDVVEKALGELIAACEPRTVQELER